MRAFLFAVFLSSSICLADSPKEPTIDSITWRNLGPAFMSGRIADIAIDSKDPSTWYIAVGSGGVWKTENAGTTFEPLFDKMSVYSIGCISIDPNNRHTIWVGTGEDVGGRHVSFGDGIYKSLDGGKTWKNMGLKNSEHISKIIVHPNDSNTIYVASQGPLWSEGGERGIYKSTDGGQSWVRVLGDDKWLGATDIIMHKEKPNTLIAVTWERHRTVATYYGGGKYTGLYKTTDGGKNWRRLNTGLPIAKDKKIKIDDIGKSAIGVSSQKPDVVYAAFEYNRTEGGFYKSYDFGESWEKQSNIVAGGTGPHYYQELWVNPHRYDNVFLAGVRSDVSFDGGKTFSKVKEEHKHSDNHALAFHPTDPEYMLMGSDGGIYESRDSGKNWRYFANLPVTQFYKLALDDTFPFYNVYGGTQDNSTQLGPVRTRDRHGILNRDWEVAMFGDGHQPATEPGNPDIAYAQWQQGNISRIDRKANERIYIKPIALSEGPQDRYNWDAPIFVSPHNPAHIMFGSQRLWYSTDRGDSWEALSGDLTRGIERMALPTMGQVQSIDGPWDHSAMSEFGTITSIAQSPKDKGIIMVGSDDGLIQVTSDFGKSWRRIEAKELGAPKNAYINDIKADLFDKDTFYIALDNHKEGDYKPYLYVTKNRGRSFRRITKGIEKNHLIWRFVQDHINPKLMFIGTEFALYYSINAGKVWNRIKANLPTISFRDLAIHRRDGDLVAASFGRGFFVFDDLTPFRHLDSNYKDTQATIFPPRKAYWYIEGARLDTDPKENGTQGANFYQSKNPPFGAAIDIYLRDDYPTLTQLRQKKEKGGKPSFEGWDKVEAEDREAGPRIVLEIANQSGTIIRKIDVKPNKGFQRLYWDLRYPNNRTIKEPTGFFALPGRLAIPGTYYASLHLIRDGESKALTQKQPFIVESIVERAITNDLKDFDVFWENMHGLSRTFAALNQAVAKMKQTVSDLEASSKRALASDNELSAALENIRQKYLDLAFKINGTPTKNRIGETNPISIGDYFFHLNLGGATTTYGPTKEQKKYFKILSSMLDKAVAEYRVLDSESIPAFKKMLAKAQAPWVEGQEL